MTALLTVKQHNGRQKIRGRKVPDSGSDNLDVYICFDSLLDADKATEDVRSVAPDSQVYYISQADYAHVDDPRGTTDRTSPFDGQVLFVATATGADDALTPDQLRAAVHDFANYYAEPDNKVRAFALHAAPNPRTWHFRVEFDRISDAFQVLSLIHDVQPAKFAVSCFDHKSLLACY